MKFRIDESKNGLHRLYSKKGWWPFNPWKSEGVYSSRKQAKDRIDEFINKDTVVCRNWFDNTGKEIM